MSDEDKESKSTSAIGTTAQIMGPNGKATVAAPKLSDDDHVEMEEILSSESAANPDEDIMQLARLGDIQVHTRMRRELRLYMYVPGSESFLGHLLIFLAVGGYQQPICYVPVSPERWRGCQ